MFQCKFCESHWEKSRSRNLHEKYCHLNPQKSVKRGGNQYTKAKELGQAKPEISQDTRSKFSELGKRWNDLRWSQPGAKEKASAAMKKAVENNPESYTSSNRGRVKQIEYHGLKFHGNWELTFYKYCEENHIKCERSSQSFPYYWNNSFHSYFPDFYLPDFGVWIEIKGYKTERDDAKWNQFPLKHVVIMKEEIKSIERNDFNLHKFLGS